MSLFKTIPMSVPGDIEIQPLLAVIRAELERQRCSVTVSKRGDLAVFAKRIPTVAKSKVVNLFKGDYPELDERIKPDLSLNRQAGTALIAFLIFVFVVCAFNFYEFGGRKFPLSATSAKASCSINSFSVCIDNFTHEKENSVGKSNYIKSFSGRDVIEMVNVAFTGFQLKISNFGYWVREKFVKNFIYRMPPSADVNNNEFDSFGISDVSDIRRAVESNDMRKLWNSHQVTVDMPYPQSWPVSSVKLLPHQFRLLTSDIGLTLSQQALFGSYINLTSGEPHQDDGKNTDNYRAETLDKSVIKVKQVEGVVKSENWIDVISAFLIPCCIVIFLYCAVMLTIGLDRSYQEPNKKNKHRDS